MGYQRFIFEEQFFEIVFCCKIAPSHLRNLQSKDRVFSYQRSYLPLVFRFETKQLPGVTSQFPGTRIGGWSSQLLKVLLYRKTLQGGGPQPQQSQEEGKCEISQISNRRAKLHTSHRQFAVLRSSLAFFRMSPASCTDP